MELLPNGNFTISFNCPGPPPPLCEGQVPFPYTPTHRTFKKLWEVCGRPGEERGDLPLL